MGADALEAACRAAMRPSDENAPDLAAALDAIGTAASATETDLQVALRLLGADHG